MIHFSIILHSWGEITLSFKEYFNCQSKGINPLQPHECDPKFMNAQMYSFPALAMTTFLMVAASPVVNLLFVFNWRHMKERLSSFLFMMSSVIALKMSSAPRT